MGSVFSGEEAKVVFLMGNKNKNQQEMGRDFDS